MTTYLLEIYEPGSPRNVWATFSSATPFMAIFPGTLMIGPNDPEKVLRVLNVTHFIYGADDNLTHKIMVYTEEVENTPGGARRWVAP